MHPGTFRETPPRLVSRLTPVPLKLVPMIARLVLFKGAPIVPPEQILGLTPVVLFKGLGQVPWMVSYGRVPWMVSYGQVPWMVPT